MKADDPFKHLKSISDPTEIEEAKTIDDLRWQGRVLFSKYDSFLEHSGAKISQIILETLKDNVMTQSLLQNS